MSANPFEKPTVNANIYQRESAKQQVDWKQIAADVTKTVTDIETDRTNRKAAIKKSYDDQQKELRSLTNKYDAVTLQQRVNDGANQMSEQIAAQYDLVLRGQLKPSEFGLIQQNVATGFEGIKSYAENFETQFDEFTKRSQIQKNGETINSKEERYDAELLLSFANLNNKIFRAGDDGIVSVLTVDDNGVPIEGQSGTVQQLNAMLYQKTDNMNLTGILGNINKQLGETALLKFSEKSGYRAVSKQDISRAEVEFNDMLNDEQNEKAQQILNDKVDVMLSDDAKVATFAANFVSTTNKGGVGDVQYSLGSKEDIAKWNADPANKGKQLPIILREFNKNSGLVQSFPTPEQTKLIKKAAKRAILGSFSVSADMESQRMSNVSVSVSPQKRPRPTQADKNNLIAGNLLRNLIQGDAQTSDIARNNIIQRWNQNAGSNTPKIESIDRLPKRDGSIVLEVKYDDNTTKELKGASGNEMFMNAWGSLISIKDGDLLSYAGPSSSYVNPETSMTPLNPNEKIMNLNKAITYDDEGEAKPVSYYEFMNGVSENFITGSIQEGARVAIEQLLKSPEFIPSELKARIKQTNKNTDTNVTFMNDGRTAVRLGDYVDYVDVSKIQNDTDGDEELYETLGRKIKDIVRDKIELENSGNRKVADDRL